MAFLCIASMGKKKSGDMSILHHSKLLYTFPFLQESNGVKHHPISPHQNKGFINYVFCRNWAVRNPAGTRLESSLVTKQVVLRYSTLYFIASYDESCTFIIFVSSSLDGHGYLIDEVGYSGVDRDTNLGGMDERKQDFLP